MCPGCVVAASAVGGLWVAERVSSWFVGRARDKRMQECDAEPGVEAKNDASSSQAAEPSPG